MINFDTYFHIKAWKQGQSHVGRVALIPTSVYATNNLCRSIETLYANIFYLYWFFPHGNLCRDEGNPTYGDLNIKSLSAKFYFMQILICGAMAIAPYSFFNIKLLSSKKYKITQHRIQP